MSRPEDLRYTKSHEWIRLEGDNVFTIGITDFAVEQLSDLAFVDLPDVGDAVEEESSFGEIESTKTVAELVSPIAGEVVATNDEVVENLQLLSHSPFDGGWLVQIRAAGEPDLSELLDAVQYGHFVETEEAH